jgi:hypothetical protein
MPTRLFTFVQMELPWELGPADGRYLLRKPAEVPDGREPQHVVVLSTIGAERKGLLGRRTRTRRAEPEPGATPVPVTRATVVDPVPLSAESQARTWLAQLDPELEAQAAADVLNRMLFAQRIAGAAPHIHEVSPAQALVLRAGFGEGEHVADGLWLDARELLLSNKRAGRRATVLRPQERLAALLAGRESHLLCEELVLRARLDLDGGRVALAAIELERAYAAALVELPREERGDLRQRIEELGELRRGVLRSARAALPTPAPGVATRAAAETSAGTTTETSAAMTAETGIETIASNSPRGVEETTDIPDDHPDPQTVRHALERLEAALRARTAPGSNLK